MRIPVQNYQFFTRFNKNFQRKGVQPPEPPMDPPLRCNFNACFAPSSILFAKYVETCVSRRKKKRPCPPLRNNKNKNKNKNLLLPIKVPQGTNNLIQWLKWLETYKDTCKHTQKTRKTYLCSVTARPDQSLSNTTINQFTFNITCIITIIIHLT